MKYNISKFSDGERIIKIEEEKDKLDKLSSLFGKDVLYSPFKCGFSHDKRKVETADPFNLYNLTKRVSIREDV